MTRASGNDGEPSCNCAPGTCLRYTSKNARTYELVIVWARSPSNSLPASLAIASPGSKNNVELVARSCAHSALLRGSECDELYHMRKNEQPQTNAKYA